MTPIFHTKTARSGELGIIPARIASLARQTFETRCLPQIERSMPWLTGRLKIG